MAAIRRRDRDGEWWVDFRYRGRRVRKRSPIQTKRGSEEFERKLRQEFLADDAAGRDPFAGPAPTFAEFAERWMREYVLARNRATVQRDKQMALKNHLLPAFGNARLDEITIERIDLFAAQRRADGLSGKTINNLLSMLRCALTSAVRWGLLRRVPEVRWLPVPTQGYRFLSADEVARLVGAARPGYWRTLVLFLVRTGARFGEAAALRWEDLDLDGPEPLVHVRRAASLGEVGPTKTNRVRAVPLGPDIASAFRAFRHEGEFIFALRNGRLPRPQSALKYLHRFCDRAGIQRVSWHVLRHTFATELVRRGAPLPAVQALLGHTTLKMTARYLHVAPNMLRDAVSVLYQPDVRRESWPPNGHQPARGNPWSPRGTENAPELSAEATQKPALVAGPCPS